MKHYQNLHIERERAYNVLEENEHTKYQNVINNPSNNVVPQPESMADTPYHTRTIKSFLAAHPDIMNSNISGNLYVLGKKVSDNPKQGSYILHWPAHIYSNLQEVPHGAAAVINALGKRDLRSMILAIRISENIFRKNCKKDENSRVIVLQDQQHHKEHHIRYHHHI